MVFGILLRGNIPLGVMKSKADLPPLIERAEKMGAESIWVPGYGALTIEEAKRLV